MEFWVLWFAVVFAVVIAGLIITANVIYRRDRKAMTPDQRKADDAADLKEGQKW